MCKRHETAEGLPIAECSTVYEWSCNGCGMVNVVRPMPIRLSDEDIEELREELELPPEVEINPDDYVSCPNVVECRNCRAKFAARTPDERFDDEPDEE